MFYTFCWPILDNILMIRFNPFLNHCAARIMYFSTIFLFDVRLLFSFSFVEHNLVITGERVYKMMSLYWRVHESNPPFSQLLYVRFMCAYTLRLYSFNYNIVVCPRPSPEKYLLPSLERESNLSSKVHIHPSNEIITRFHEGHLSLSYTLQKLQGAIAKSIFNEFICNLV